jgi:hypothetical protein
MTGGEHVIMFSLRNVHGTYGLPSQIRPRFFRGPAEGATDTHYNHASQRNP